MDFEKISFIKDKPDYEQIWSTYFCVGQGNEGKLRLEEFLEAPVFKMIAQDNGESSLEPNSMNLASMDPISKSLATLLFESVARGKTMDLK
jgi:hypothetical protein